MSRAERIGLCGVNGQISVLPKWPAQVSRRAGTGDGGTSHTSTACWGARPTRAPGGTARLGRWERRTGRGSRRSPRKPGIEIPVLPLGSTVYSPLRSTRGDSNSVWTGCQLSVSGVVVPSDSPLAAPLASPVEPVSSSTAHEYRSFSSLLPNQHERGWLGNSNYSLFSEHLRGWV